MTLRRFLSTWLPVILTACLVAALADVAAAQVAGGGRGTRAGGGRPARPPSGPPSLQAPEGGDGSEYSSLIKYTPVDDEKLPDIMGTLKVMPFKKGGKVLTLRVPKTDDFKITIAGIEFTPDRFAEILTKGLHCTASWRSEETDGKKKSGKKDLVSLHFEPLKVVGTLEKVEGDMIVLRARPADNREWPDVDAASRGVTNRPPPPSSGGKNGVHPPATPPKPPEAKKPKPRNLKLKVLEDLAKFVDSENKPIELSDFEIGKTVEAQCVLGTTVGYLTQMQSSTAQVTKNEPRDKRQPPPPSGGRPGKKGGGGI